MTDPIRESVAKRLYPDAWYFAGSDEDKCAALAKADYAIRAVTGALEAQGYVVVPRGPSPPAHTYDPADIDRFHLERDTLAGWGAWEKTGR